MFKKAFFVLLVSCLLFLNACKNQLNDILTFPKKFITESNHVIITGSWHVSSKGSYYIQLPKNNVARIVCTKEKMICTENIALLYKPDKIVDSPFLDIAEHQYYIHEWTPDIISARAEYPAADLELRIVIQDESAERFHRETKRHGVETSDSNISLHYILK